MWLIGLYTVIVWDLHYVPPFDADLPPVAWHWRFPFVVTLLLALNLVMSIIHLTNNRLREFATARSVHGLGVAVIAAVEVLSRQSWCPDCSVGAHGFPFEEGHSVASRAAGARPHRFHGHFSEHS